MQDDLIALLKQSDGHISGEELSRRFKVSRTAIWKKICELRKDGYEIDAVTHTGYRLRGTPEHLVAREMTGGLQTRRLGRKVIIHEELASTMDAAARLAMEGEVEGTVVCAERQTEGRGRMGRTWLSPKGEGLYFSMILRPQLLPLEVSRLTFTAAIALCEAAREVGAQQAAIKWPNDILVENSKLAGILIEMSGEIDRVHHVILGVGINVNTDESALPPGAASLKSVLGHSVARVDLFQSFCRRLEFWYDELQRTGFVPVVDRWKQLTCTLGNRVRLIEGKEQIEGVAEDLDEHGGLIIRCSDGMVVKRMSGDVIHLESETASDDEDI